MNQHPIIGRRNATVPKTKTQLVAGIISDIRPKLLKARKRNLPNIRQRLLIDAEEKIGAGK